MYIGNDKRDNDDYIIIIIIIIIIIMFYAGASLQLNAVIAEIVEKVINLSWCILMSITFLIVLFKHVFQSHN